MGDCKAKLMPNRVRPLRKRQRLTLEDLADHVGISVSELAQIERGELVPSVYTGIHLANALGVQAHLVFLG